MLYVVVCSVDLHKLVFYSLGPIFKRGSCSCSSNIQTRIQIIFPKQLQNGRKCEPTTLVGL